jgi:hypothetical protein
MGANKLLDKVMGEQEKYNAELEFGDMNKLEDISNKLLSLKINHYNMSENAEYPDQKLINNFKETFQTLLKFTSVGLFKDNINPNMLHPYFDSHELKNDLKNNSSNSFVTISSSAHLSSDDVENSMGLSGNRDNIYLQALQISLKEVGIKSFLERSPSDKGKEKLLNSLIVPLDNANIEAITKVVREKMPVISEAIKIELEGMDKKGKGISSLPEAMKWVPVDINGDPISVGQKQEVLKIADTNNRAKADEIRENHRSLQEALAETKKVLGKGKLD